MKIKIIFAFVLIGLCSLVGSAQNNSVVTNFEKNKTKYKLEKFAEGEDASSGFDYLYYKNKDQIVKVRIIWSSSANPNYWVEDYFYDGGKLSAVIKYDLTKKNYNNARLGKTVALKEVEKLIFTDEKLNSWDEKSKAVPKNDERWNEKEKQILESGKSRLEYYQDLKADT